MKQPLRLEHYFFAKVHIEANPPTEGKEETLPPTATINVGTAVDLMRHEKDSHKYQLTLAIHDLSCDERPLPYLIEIQVVGIFVVDPEFKHDDINRLITVNGASLLYSAMREFVLMTTGRGPWGAFQLPTINFHQIVLSQGNAAKEAISKPSRKKPKSR